MEVNDPDLDAFETATRAQLRARELGKIGALISNLRPNAPVPAEMGKSSHENAPRESQCGASSHEQSDSDESPPEDLEKSTEWIFEGYLFFSSDGWRTDEAYEAEVRAVPQWWNSNIYRKFLSRSSTWQFFMIQWPNPTEMF